ncbi:DNA-binding protein [Lichenihabitans psoromatis]|uniref:DNA-binding protein n=1 Tax=Lichenihabitans psoromatis TaxID=2528642 RepID=UPI001036247A|nr:DNA-binding protein [Lichenihabitans psoromatis]
MMSQTPDLLYGMPAIADHLGLKVPQARHLSDKRTIPTFKVGRLTCARRTTLTAWLIEQEAKACTIAA